MDEKSLRILEYFKILEHVGGYCEFPVSEEKALDVRPSGDVFEARRLLAETREAVEVLASHPEISIGGARDIRADIDLAAHGGVLASNELLDIKFTLISARSLGRLFERSNQQFPGLADIAAQLPPPLGIIDAISSAISDRGDILDSASENLSSIRRDLRVVHDRLLSRLQKMVSNPDVAPLLQETLITQRDGRYVLPLRTEFKGRIKSIVHDQSSSGATIFVEPLTVVDLNNQYRELHLAERDEERRILAALSQQVGFYSNDLLQAVEIIAELDLALAKAKYAIEIQASEPVLRVIKDGGKPQHPGTVMKLYQARHPLLDPETVVPIDVELSPETYALVITGPNTGGKTVVLKTVGLLALMAQSGLHIPALKGTEISLFDVIYADIGDEQSIEQSLSTFSSHITNIIRILAHADSKSLVILDELGAGTDPQEGAALARALLTHLLDHGITTLVSTHHPELKAFAHATSGVNNASVEFDLLTLRPTYRLTIGLPGRSNAMAIAERLGLPESIIRTARSEIRSEDIRADDLLDEIQQQRDLAHQSRSAAEKSRQESEVIRSELVEHLEEIEDERVQILEEARLESEAQIQEIKAEVEKVKRELTRLRQPTEALSTIKEQVEELEADFVQPEPTVQPVLFIPLDRPIKPGDKVRLRTLGTKGVLLSLGEEDAEVQVGNVRVRTRLRDLELIGAGDLGLESRGEPAKSGGTNRRQDRARAGSTSTGNGDFFTDSPGMEINLRGQRADEALDSLERYLDSAYLAGLPFVRIVHGKGTGKLRQVVREALKGYIHVKSFEAGKDNEGGEGVTVAKLDV